MPIHFKRATKAAAAHGIDLNVLKKSTNGIAEGKNLGGRYALPAEFPATKFAASFVKKGSAVEAAKQIETLKGTDIQAPGWTVWTYPDGSDNAGSQHEVHDENATFILMYRPIEIQNAANFVYGEASRDRLKAEVNGETVASAAPDDPGVLTSDRLNQVPALRSESEMLQRQREKDEESGQQSSIFAGQRPRGKIISRKKTKLNK